MAQTEQYFQNNRTTADILIAGSGCSALYFALQAPRDRKIILITKSDFESSDSFLAQGGICMLRDDADYDSYFEDTLKAGHYENDRKSVDIMLRSSQKVIRDLIGYGAEFARDAEGNLDFTREGCHSAKRILYHKDITGKEITSHLLEQVKKLPNVEMYEYTTLVDIVEKDNTCYGAVVRMADGSLKLIASSYTVLATGGIGGLYRYSTNFRHLTGDALAIALRHHIALKNINYVQIHPTTFYTEKEEDRSFLISESARGEGAKLYDKQMHRFANELLPRDILTEAIRRQMKKDGTSHVWEDLGQIDAGELKEHFPNIVEHCREQGYDAARECIPVVPAQHYFMGGIRVDHESRTTMDRLYAVGETACNGVHGKNRLASNSLLESLVFAGRAAADVAEKPRHRNTNQKLFARVNLAEYADEKKLAADYARMVQAEIDRVSGGSNRSGVPYRHLEDGEDTEEPSVSETCTLCVTR